MGFWAEVKKRWNDTKRTQEAITPKSEVVHVDIVDSFLATEDIEIRMVGEPIRSIIRDAILNPKHWKLQNVVSTSGYGGRGYKGICVHKPSGKQFSYSSSWEGDCWARLTVKDVGFSINAWEQRALVHCFRNRLKDTLERIGSLRSMQRERLRKQNEQKELDARKQLKEQLGL
jgi:hypothetical protein